jgi:hypothetical protein
MLQMSPLMTPQLSAIRAAVSRVNDSVAQLSASVDTTIARANAIMGQMSISIVGMGAMEVNASVVAEIKASMHAQFVQMTISVAQMNADIVQQHAIILEQFTSFRQLLGPIGKKHIAIATMIALVYYDLRLPPLYCRLILWLCCNPHDCAVVVTHSLETLACLLYCILTRQCKG